MGGRDMCEEGVRLPNELLLGEADKAMLRLLFDVVRNRASFHSVGELEWRLSVAEFQPVDRLLSDYGYNGSGAQWYEDLKSAVAGHTELAVFCVEVSNRRGLEHYPSHVKGRSIHYLVDCSKREVVHEFESLFST
jgi:hypothetical protein